MQPWDLKSNSSWACPQDLLDSSTVPSPVIRDSCPQLHFFFFFLVGAGGQDHISLTSPLAGLTKEVTSFGSGLGKRCWEMGFSHCEQWIQLCISNCRIYYFSNSFSPNASHRSLFWWSRNRDRGEYLFGMLFVKMKSGWMCKWVVKVSKLTHSGLK